MLLAGLLLLGLIVMTGLLIAAEMAVYSTRPERLRQIAQSGNRNARHVLAFVRRPTPLLSAMQIAVTLLSVLIGALAQSRITEPLTALWSNSGTLGSYAESVAFWTVIVSTTMVSVVFGSLLPKRIALWVPERVAIKLTPLMLLVMRGLSPISGLFSVLTDGLSRVLRIPKNTQRDVTEGDMDDLLKEGMRRGTLNEQEARIIRQAFQLSDVTARQVMVPRQDIKWVNLRSTKEEQSRAIRENRHSRLIVSDGKLDDAVGVLTERDYLLREPLEVNELRELLDPIVRVPPTASLLKLLEVFRESGARILVVTDEHGVVLGIVSAQDLIQALIGQVST